MADWVYAPRYDARWEEEPPPTLITKLSDGKRIGRQENPSATLRWEEVYDFTGAEHDAAHAFYKARYLLTSFMKLSYTEAGTPTDEEAVYYDSAWRVVRAGEDWFIVSLAFEQAH